MPHVRLLTGEKRGTVVVATPTQAKLWLESGRAELVAQETSETPERTTRRRRKPETRDA